MPTYASSFIPGLGEVVARGLERALVGFKLDLLLDGLVVYRSSSSVSDVRALPFCNNSFVCLMTFDGLGRNAIAVMGRAVLADGRFARRLVAHLPGRKQTFRVMASYANQFVSVPQRTRVSLERLLAAEPRLRLDRSTPDVELWLLARREGFGCAGLRITRHRAYEKTLARGELRPELCHLLCLIAEPSPEDVVLDPFCGSGAIPLAWTRAFPYHSVLAGDIDAAQVKRLRAKLRGEKVKITVGRWDAQRLRTFEADSIDKIVSDPPWGFYRNEIADLAGFQRTMLREFSRVLRPGGFLVLLVGQPDIFVATLGDAGGGFTLRQRYDILVSGKKASVFKLEKT